MLKRVRLVYYVARELRYKDTTLPSNIANDKHNLDCSKAGCFIGNHFDNEDGISPSAWCFVSLGQTGAVRVRCHAGTLPIIARLFATGIKNSLEEDKQKERSENRRKLTQELEWARDLFFFVGVAEMDYNQVNRIYCLRLFTLVLSMEGIKTASSILS